MAKWILAALCLGCTSLGAAESPRVGKEDEFNFGGVKLTLGAPKETVIAALALQFDLQTVPQSDDKIVGVTRKGAHKDPVGMVTFSNGRLAGASIPWSLGKDKCFDATHALYGAVSNMIGEGPALCRLSSSRRQGPNGVFEAVSIQCEGWRVELLAVESAELRGQYASVSQKIGDQ